MEFCNKCGNINYIREIKDLNKLEYYCKNCNNITDYNVNNYCVYNNKYNNDLQIHNITNNKWLTKDPTLPILTNIDCINESCICNNYEENSILIYSTDDTLLSEIKKNFNDDEYEDIVKLDNISRLTFKSNEILEKNKKKINELKKTKEIKIFNKPEKQVTFVKYDNENMKYLYICNHCYLSWKNN